MGKNIAKKESQPSLSLQEEIKKQITEPWISKNTGIIVILVISFIFTLWVYSTGNSDAPFFERLGVALLFGATIWVVAILFYVFHRFIMRK